MPFCSHDCFRGTPNKINGALKEAILEAAEEAGGEHVVQAHANPATFMSVLGKVLPMTRLPA
jgi:hypothetical protein